MVVCISFRARGPQGGSHDGGQLQVALLGFGYGWGGAQGTRGAQSDACSRRRLTSVDAGATQPSRPASHHQSDGTCPCILHFWLVPFALSHGSQIMPYGTLSKRKGTPGLLCPSWSDFRYLQQAPQPVKAGGTALHKRVQVTVTAVNAGIPEGKDAHPERPCGARVAMSQCYIKNPESSDQGCQTYPRLPLIWRNVLSARELTITTGSKGPGRRLIISTCEGV